ncbi:hypothetical protein PT974_03203 [Cladobotryum mycophilum]|uniref:Uncharacterized protein n=1 Tax=Cladobotryum mycophilum TaxID=491253 RepID=A0ABR0SRZ5_9HYPO
MASQGYYDTIKNATAFVRNADSPNKTMSFIELQQSAQWESGASRWGVPHLFACRVICADERDVLPLLESKFDRVDLEKHDPCIRDLVKGPEEDNSTLKDMPELKIVRKYDGRGSLGYIWAAMGPLLRLDSSFKPSAASQKPQRETRPPSRYGDFVSSETHVTPLEGRPDTGDSVPSTVGYLETSTAPLVEEYTCRFLNCLIRCVLNYSQSEDKDTSFIQYRDERLAYGYKVSGDKLVEAIDDGGMEIVDGNRRTQVVILEAKRSFQTIPGGGGRPTVVNELLAQVVGEALALMRSGETRTISNTDVISIVAVKHYIKIFHFKITPQYLRQFERLRPTQETQDTDTFLHVQTTKWFDVSGRKGREYFVRHLIALISWADDIITGDA